jgi:hypothetical protein
MPNGTLFDADIFQQSIADVSQYLNGLGSNISVLDQADLNELSSSRRATLGWAIDVEFSDGVVRPLLLLISQTFPFDLPKVAMADNGKYMEWPHVEEDGVLCLTQSSVSIDAFDAVKLVQFVLSAACNLIEENLVGNNAADFQNEFYSYWLRKVERPARVIYAMLDGHPESRLIKVWEGVNNSAVFDDQKNGERWVENFFHVSKKEKFKCETGVLIWLKSAPVPPYPETPMDFVRLAEKEGDSVAIELLAQVLKKTPANLCIIFGFTTENGPAYGSFSAYKPKSTGAPTRKMGNITTKGFRPGKVPNSLLLQKYFSVRGELHRHYVQRVDQDWVYGRGADVTSKTVRDKLVAIVGLGSVGSTLAKTLARAGVGRLIFIDKDTLSWPNLGRHELGADHIGQSKSEAMAGVLKAEHPLIEITHSKKISLQSALVDKIDLLKECDLIIDVAADWSASSLLNLVTQDVLSHVPVLYGWVERFSVAGHAISIMPGDEKCLQCGCNHTGALQTTLIDWGQEPQVFQEPACGTVFHPYGPAELSYCNAMISNVAIERPIQFNRFFVSTRFNIRLSSGIVHSPEVSPGMPPLSFGILRLFISATISFCVISVLSCRAKTDCLMSSTMAQIFNALSSAFLVRTTAEAAAARLASPPSVSPRSRLAAKAAFVRLEITSRSNSVITPSVRSFIKTAGSSSKPISTL